MCAVFLREAMDRVEVSAEMFSAPASMAMPCDGTCQFCEALPITILPMRLHCGGILPAACLPMSAMFATELPREKCFPTSLFGKTDSRGRHAISLRPVLFRSVSPSTVVRLRFVIYHTR